MLDVSHWHSSLVVCLNHDPVYHHSGVATRSAKCREIDRAHHDQPRRRGKVIFAANHATSPPGLLLLAADWQTGARAASHALTAMLSLDLERNKTEMEM